MLTIRQLATVRAALLFWKEEIAGHDPQIAKPYLEDDFIQPLDSEEVEQLRGRFKNVRYVAYVPQTDTLASHVFLQAEQEQSLRLPTEAIATVIFPN